MHTVTIILYLQNVAYMKLFSPNPIISTAHQTFPWSLVYTQAVTEISNRIAPCSAVCRPGAGRPWARAAATALMRVGIGCCVAVASCSGRQTAPSAHRHSPARGLSARQWHRPGARRAFEGSVK